MRYWLLASVLALTGCDASSRAPEHSASIALTSVDVIDVVTGEIAIDNTILVEGNRIIAVLGPTTDFTAERKIDYDGHYAIPGLWDMHIHGSNDLITRKVIFPLLIAHGVTGVRVMESDCLPECEWWASSIYEARIRQSEIRNGDLVGPHLYLGGDTVFGTPPGETSSVLAPGNEEDGRALARLYKERGVDFIKIYSGVPLDAAKGITDEANKIGLAFGGHVPEGMSLLEFSALGAEAVEHVMGAHVPQLCASNEQELLDELKEAVIETKSVIVPNIAARDEFDPELCNRALRQLAHQKTWWVPTLVVEDFETRPARFWESSPLIDYIPDSEREYWAEDSIRYKAYFDDPDGLAELMLHYYRLVGLGHDAGVQVLAGTDAGIVGMIWGDSLHEELERLIVAGLTPLEALQTATSQPAKFLGLEQSIGNIKPQMTADIVVLRANPLEEISATREIEAVISHGRFLDRAEIDAMLEQIKVDLVAINETVEPS